MSRRRALLYQSGTSNHLPEMDTAAAAAASDSAGTRLSFSSSKPRQPRLYSSSIGNNLVPDPVDGNVASWLPTGVVATASDSRDRYSNNSKDDETDDDDDDDDDDDFLPNVSPDSSAFSVSMHSFEQQQQQTQQQTLPYSPGALQFVPALEKSSYPTAKKANTTWEALMMEDDDDEKKTDHSPPTTTTTWRGVDTTKRTRTHMACARNNNNNDPPQRPLVGVSPPVRRSGRMAARIASMFTSRAVAVTTAPPSPARSSTSSGGGGGYVGWPGTVDARGGVVTTVHSYEDSSVVRRTANHNDGRSAPSDSGVAPNRLGTRSRVNQRQGWNNNNNNARTTTFQSTAAAAVVVGKKPPASPATSGSTSGASKTSSSAYLDSEEMARLGYPSLDDDDIYLQQQQRSQPAPPMTEAYLAANDHYQPPHRAFPQKGYQGLIEKTMEVPSLFDEIIADSDSMASSSSATNYHHTTARHKANHHDSYYYHNRGVVVTNHAAADHDSDVFDGLSSFKESDVFDNISGSSPRRGNPTSNTNTTATASPKSYYVKQRTAPAAYYRRPERIAEEEEHPYTNNAHSADTNPESSSSFLPFNLVHLAGGLTAIQSPSNDFTNRFTAADFDENLTNSEVDQDGFTRTPGFQEMLSAGLVSSSALRGIHGNIGATSTTRQQRGTVGSHKNRSLLSSKTGPLANPMPRSPPAVNRVTSQEPLTDSSSSAGRSESSSLFTDPYDNDQGNNNNNNASFHTFTGDLSKYYVTARDMKKLVRQYRELSEDCDPRGMTLDEFEKEEDEHKAFALIEMRSRIMNKDLERGLERRGGTVPVDDIVTTSYHRAAMRIRDAVVVSKAWRDGASPMDVMNSALLTRRAERTHYIKRPIMIAGGGGSFGNNSGDSSMRSGYAEPRRYEWEAVRWVDDTDFMQYRCPSLGPRTMRGFEIFTIGDCQSILLKLTNEQCINLRDELDDATRRQIEAEDLLRYEGDVTDNILSMTDAEMMYLCAMEEVKTISKKLVAAEQAFELVRDRIQELVTRYQELLVQIETESFTGASSVVTYESSEHDSQLEKREKAVWARRAQRAEIRAELAAREALVAKQEARMVREQQQLELDALQKKLSELQSESSANNKADKDLSSAIARRYTTPDTDSDSVSRKAMNKEKIDGVKQRFRERIAAKKRDSSELARSVSPAPIKQQHHSQRPYYKKPVPVPPSPTSARSLFRSAGEDLLQQMDFYERSLRSVDLNRYR
jgi:hypothetical protein